MNDTSAFFSQNNSNINNSDTDENPSSVVDTNNNFGGDAEPSSDIDYSNDQDSNINNPISAKEKPAKELSATEKQIRDAEEKLRKLKEKDKIQKRKQKEKNENDILKVLRSKGLLKVSVSKWEEKISEVAKVFS